MLAFHVFLFVGEGGDVFFFPGYCSTILESMGIAGIAIICIYICIPFIPFKSKYNIYIYIFDNHMFRRIYYSRTMVSEI